MGRAAQIMCEFGQKYICDNKEFFVDLLLAFFTFLVVFVALFGNWLRSIIFKPKLIFKSVETVPQVQYIEERKESPVVTGGIINYHKQKYTMYRALVINDGCAPARNVRALITNIPQPLNLYWTHIDKITRDISKKELAYLDVIQETNGEYYFYRWANIIDLPEYKLSNTNPKEIKIDFFEKNHVLQSVRLKLDPVTKTLEVL